MNKIIKILLLIISIIGAFGGIMFFYKTIVSPPAHLSFKNQYIDALKTDISTIPQTDYDFKLDSFYYSIIYEIDFQQDNSLFSDQERDELLESFCLQYVPLFVKSCKSIFESNVCDENVLNPISSRINELYSMNSTNGRKIIGGEVYESLKSVQHDIDLYYAAKKAASDLEFRGISESVTKINTTKRFLKIWPIKNCSELVARLASYPSRLEQSHYSYLAGQVELLKYYYNYNPTEYDALSARIIDQFIEYKNNAFNIYGRASNIEELKDIAANYYKDAQTYFTKSK